VKTNGMIVGSVALMTMLTACSVSKPGSLETQIAQTVKHDLTVGGKKDASPLPNSEDNIKAGRRAFNAYCYSCHGLDGQNTGVPFADRMAPPVPSLASATVQKYTDGQLKWIIANGVYPSGMPASKGLLSDEEMWSIVQYIRHLPAKGSLGEPKAFNGSAGE
jgi:S-disulfanyl-L-cysteine oxidoreductase SoxD